MRKDLKKYLKLKAVGIEDCRLLKQIVCPPKRTICGDIKDPMLKRMEEKADFKSTLARKWGLVSNQPNEKWRQVSNFSQEMALFLSNTKNRQATTSVNTIKDQVAIAAQVFKNFQPLSELIGIQTISKYDENLYVTNNGLCIQKGVTPKTFRMKASWKDECLQDLRPQFNLDPYTELLAVVGQELALEVIQYVLRQLFEKVPMMHYPYPIYHDLTDGSIEDWIEWEFDAAGIKDGEWIVTSREIIEKMNLTHMPDTFTSSLTLNKMGYLGRRQYPVYENPIWTNQILLGRKKHWYDAGYYWLPKSLELWKGIDPAEFITPTKIHFVWAEVMANLNYYRKLVWTPVDN